MRTQHQVAKRNASQSIRAATNCELHCQRQRDNQKAYIARGLIVVSALLMSPPEGEETKESKETKHHSCDDKSNACAKEACANRVKSPRNRLCASDLSSVDCPASPILRVSAQVTPSGSVTDCHRLYIFVR